MRKSARELQARVTMLVHRHQDHELERMPAALDRISEALRDAARGCDEIAHDFQHADWPEGRRPCNERISGLLAALHDAAATSRAAARRCDRAAAAAAAMGES